MVKTQSRISIFDWLVAVMPEAPVKEKLKPYNFVKDSKTKQLAPLIVTVPLRTHLNDLPAGIVTGDENV